MLKNPAFLVNMQIALIGVLLVVGFFYIWRFLTRMEEKVDHIGKLITSRPQAPPMPMHIQPMMDDELAEKMMQDIFGGGAPIFLNTFDGNAQQDTDAVKIEEIPETTAPVSAAVEDVPEENASQAPSVTVGLTKSKVMRMTSDALRQLCGQMNLSSEGTRQEMLQRVLEKIGESDA